MQENKNDFIDKINYVIVRPSKMVAVTSFASNSAIDKKLYLDFLNSAKTSSVQSASNPAVRYVINLDNISYINASGIIIFDGGGALADIDESKNKLPEEYFVEPDSHLAYFTR